MFSKSLIAKKRGLTSNSPSLILLFVCAFLCLRRGDSLAAEIPRRELVTRIEQAIESGSAFLIQQQGSDGQWRSSIYGLLKDGRSLTPLVFSSLPESTTTRVVRGRSLSVIRSWIKRDGESLQVSQELTYPIYTAGLLLSSVSSPELLSLDERNTWQDLLIQHQLAESNGWCASDPRFGGWGYSHEPPRKPTDDNPLSPLNEPNLSATTFALEGLSRRQLTNPPGIQDPRTSALQFVQRCQNWDHSAPSADDKFNDGGFHFILRDEVRNKPGVAGVDAAGRTRFVSYGSSTADGMRALLLCGLSSDHPRVTAAQRWLTERFDTGDHAGSYPTDRKHLQPALDFYYAASLAKALHTTRMRDARLSQGRWAATLAQRLLDRQKTDGSWTNPCVDVREDDPLIATSFALQALQTCLNELQSPE